MMEVIVLSPEELDELEDIEAAADMMRRLEAGTFYKEHEDADEWLRNRGRKIDEIVERRNEIKKYLAWRSRVEAGLPDLSKRVFALREKSYLGCGFQWSIEKELGKVIFSIMNHDDAPLDPSISAVAKRLIIKSLVHHMFKTVHHAEISTTAMWKWQ